MIDGFLLLQYVEALARFGRHPNGGLFRTVYSPAWLEAREAIAAWLEDAGLDVREDAAGNLWGRLGGPFAAGPAVVTGSHLDTVKQGGALDGALGILAGIVAARAIRDRASRLRRPIEVVALCEEEGSRFACDFWGSRAITGRIRPDEPQQLRDADGLTLAEAMEAIGLDPARLGEARRDDIAAFVELHIEQGRNLVDGGQSVGVVNAITGLRHSEVTYTGRPDHAGTTAMTRRKDALAGAAEIVLRAEALARELGEPAVATVGQLTVLPGAVNIVPGVARFTLDVRHSVPTMLDHLLERIDAAVTEVAERRGLAWEHRTLVEHPPQPLDPRLLQTVLDAARSLDLDCPVLVSGAGHDAGIMARAFPSVMIFTQSHEGRSHCPEERTDAPHLVAATNLLAATLERLAGE